jgi:hypothetical protein
MPCCICLGDAGARIGRAVVDQQELPIGKGLRDHALDRFLDEVRRVEEYDYHRNQRFIIHRRLLVRQQTLAVACHDARCLSPGQCQPSGKFLAAPVKDRDAGQHERISGALNELALTGTGDEHARPRYQLAG